MVFEPHQVVVSEGGAQAKPGRLLLLSTDMGMGGGAEEQVIRIAYGFKARGWETMIVNMLWPNPMPPGFEDRGVLLAHLGMRQGLPDPRGVARLAQIIRDFRPDVVHSHMTHANLLARFVRVLRPFPVLVCTLHNLTMAGVKRDRSSLFELAHRLTDSRAELTTAICHAASEYYVRRGAVPEGKMRVIPNGIDTQAFAPDAAARERMRAELRVEGRFVWLAVARLELQKAYPTLLRAFARLGPGERVLLICGEGSLAERLRGLVDELGIAERVRFLGVRGDVPDLMRAADAFALSSDMEGLPLVLLQAGAACLPIVATDVGGNSEIVVDGNTGFLVPPGDPQAFAGAMRRLESLPGSVRSTLGDAGRRRVQALFEAERVIDRWEKLYFELLNPSGAPALPRRGASVRAEPPGGPSGQADEPRRPRRMATLPSAFQVVKGELP
jgi:glycosyltransferase involved in cell wall biosynthesis